MNPPSQRVELLTVMEVARLMRVSKDTVYDLIARGELEATDIGHGRAKTRIRSDVYEAYVAAHTRRIKKTPA